MVQLKQLGLLLIFPLGLIGCMGRPVTSAERERAREVLSETSPRNLNKQPKATPEFKKSFPLKRRDKSL